MYNNIIMYRSNNITICNNIIMYNNIMYYNVYTKCRLVCYVVIVMVITDKMIQ